MSCGLSAIAEFPVVSSIAHPVLTQRVFGQSACTDQMCCAFGQMAIVSRLGLGLGLGLHNWPNAQHCSSNAQIDQVCLNTLIQVHRYTLQQV